MKKEGCPLFYFESGPQPFNSSLWIRAVYRGYLFLRIGGRLCRNGERNAHYGIGTLISKRNTHYIMEQEHSLKGTHQKEHSYYQKVLIKKEHSSKGTH